MVRESADGCRRDMLSTKTVRPVILLVLVLALAGLTLSLVTLGLHWRGEGNGVSRFSSGHEANVMPAGHSAETAQRLCALEARVDELERDLRMVRVTRARLTGEADEESMTGVASLPKDLPDYVASAIEDEHQRTIDRRVALRQQADLDALEDLGKQVELSSSESEDLQRILFSVSERITMLIDDGTTARRPWAEVRRDMDEVGRVGLEDVREILSPAELEIFGEISRSHGTALMIPPSAVSGEIAEMGADP